MTVKTIEIQDTQAQLKELLLLVLQGVEVVFSQDDMPMIRLVPVAEDEAPSRIAGLHQDSIKMKAGFDEPFEDEFWLGEE